MSHDTLNPEIAKQESAFGDKQEMFRFVIHFHRAMQECDPKIADIVSDMGEILLCDESTDDEKTMAVDTIEDAIFPCLSVDLREFLDQFETSTAAEQIKKGLNEEEVHFSDKVRELMSEREISQQQLADAIGVTQPAVSLLLNRECRPQRRTVQRIAKALDVDVSEIWPK